MEFLANTLRSARKAKGYTLKDVESITGVSISTISNVEHGTDPTAPILFKLARAYGLSLDVLAGLIKPGSERLVLTVTGRAAANPQPKPNLDIPQDMPVDLTGCFLMRVVDDSMDPVVKHNQMVLVCPETKMEVRSGDLVIAELPEGMVFKRYLDSKDGHQLLSVNITKTDLPARILPHRPFMMKVVGALFDGSTQEHRPDNKTAPMQKARRSAKDEP